MTKPVYTLKLLCDSYYLKQESFGNEFAFGLPISEDTQEQTTDLTALDFGDTVLTHQGQQFKFSSNINLKKITVKLRKIGNPIDNVRMRLWNADGSSLLQTSSTTVNGTTLDSTPTPKDFDFDYELQANTVYLFALYRVISSGHASNYYSTRANLSDIYTDGIRMTSDDNAVTWDDQTGNDMYFIVTGENLVTHAGELFHVAAFDADVLRVTINLGIVGTPTDNVKMELRSSGGSILATSADSKDNTELGEQEFAFEYSLTADTDYYFFLYRDGDEDDTNYWTVKQLESDVYEDGNKAYIEDGVIVDVVTDELYFKIRFGEIEVDDLADHCTQITINRGKSDVDGAVVEGVMDVTLQNQNGRYTPNNLDSDINGIFRVNTKLALTANYDSVDYDLFYGYITSITPELNVGGRFTAIKVSDRFYPFRDEKISVGLQSGKTANELVTAVLVDLGLVSAEYDVEIDTQVLLDATWNDELALAKLAEVVEVGQHHHFIGGDGKYYFKNNQWLSSSIPDYTYDQDDVDYAYIEDILDGVKNKIKVKYGSNYVTEEGPESQEKYSIRELILENDLMPSATAIYATFIAEFLRDLFQEPGNSLVFTLSNEYPDILNIDFGTIIYFSDTFSGFNAICNVFIITQRIDPSGDHHVEYKTRKWILPPDVGSYYELEPFIGDEWLTLSEDITKFSQGFELTAGNGIIYFAWLTLKTNLTNLQAVAVRIYAADGSGFPTGSVLATSNPVVIEAGVQSGTYEFSFGEGERYELTQNADYCLVVETDKSDGSFSILPIENQTALDEDTTQISQGFTLPKDGSLSSIQLKWDYSFLSGVTITDISCRIYAADGSGFPTGSILGSSNNIVVTGSATGETRTFTFPTPVSLTGGVEYCAVFINLQKSGYEIIPVPISTVLLGGDNNRDKAQTFETDETGDLDRVVVRKFQYSCGASTQMKAYLYATSGGKPTGSSLAESDAIDLDGAPGGKLVYDLEFPNIDYTLVTGTRYAIVFKQVGPVTTNFQIYGYDSSPYTDGDWVTRDGGGTWNIQAGKDTYIRIYLVDAVMNFKVYGQDNFYADGVGAYFDGSWNLIPTNRDFKIICSLEDYINLWEIWGQDTDQYSNFIPAEYDGSAWASLAPWDFYFKVKVLSS